MLRLIVKGSPVIYVYVRCSHAQALRQVRRLAFTAIRRILPKAVAKSQLIVSLPTVLQDDASMMEV